MFGECTGIERPGDRRIHLCADLGAEPLGLRFESSAHCSARSLGFESGLHLGEDLGEESARFRGEHLLGTQVDSDSGWFVGELAGHCCVE